MGPLLDQGIKPIGYGNLASSITDSNNYLVRTDEDILIEFKYAVPFPEKFYSPDEAQVILLEHTNLPENRIYEIKLDGFADTAGHLLPLSLLESNESDIAKNNTHKFTDSQIQRIKSTALLCFCHLLKIIIKDNKFDETSVNELTKIFGENTAVLIITTAPERAPQPFDILSFLPNLFKYGYLFKPNIYANSVDDKLNRYAKFEVCTSKVMALSKVSDDFTHIEFLKEVFCKTFPRHWSPVISFFLCYQFIEILIEEIRVLNGQNFLMNLTNSMNDRVKSENIIREYQQENNEKSRIKKLISTHTRTNIEHDIKIDKCLSFLDEVNQKKDSFAENIYTMRNYFFHAFSIVADKCNNDDKLEDICWEMYLVTLKILVSYKKSIE